MTRPVPLQNTHTQPSPAITAASHNPESLGPHRSIHNQDFTQANLHVAARHLSPGPLAHVALASARFRQPYPPRISQTVSDSSALRTLLTSIVLVSCSAASNSRLSRAAKGFRA